MMVRDLRGEGKVFGKAKACCAARTAASAAETKRCGEGRNRQSIIRRVAE